MYNHQVPVALSVDVFDPLALRGVQADLKTFSALGVHGTAAISGLSLRPVGALDRAEIPPDRLTAQIEAVMTASEVASIKIGQLPSPEAVAAFFGSVKGRNAAANLVLDPFVSRDTEARPEGLLDALKEQLLPSCLVATPSVEEAEVLVGRELENWDRIREAAEELQATGCANVVITGMQGDGAYMVDLLFDGSNFREFTAEKVERPTPPGTGGAFAAALTATLAKGDNVATAVAAGKAYVTKALQESFTLGEAGPAVHHFYRYWRPQIRPPSPES